jgi:hypothetical protein
MTELKFLAGHLRRLAAASTAIADRLEHKITVSSHGSSKSIEMPTRSNRAASRIATSCRELAQAIDSGLASMSDELREQKK